MSFNRGAVRFLGKQYPLVVEKSPLLRKNGFCELAEDTMHVLIPAKLNGGQQKAAVIAALKTWYQKQAAEILLARTKHYAAQIGVQFKSIKLSDPKSRWGSCGRDGRLMFSWRIVMGDIEVVDYLVVHELCHLVHFNHSKAYWCTVENILPDYKARRAKLEKLKVF